VPTGVSPEAKVLIVMTGGTICMERSPLGLIPARNFVDRCMATRPEFNDGSDPEPTEVRVEEDDGPVSRQLKSLRTPFSAYGKRIRYVLFFAERLHLRSALYQRLTVIVRPRYAVLEFETLLDSSSIDSQGWAEIAETISRNYTLFDGFVVLHGTDSLAYTGSALSFMLQNLGKPVILTGRYTASDSPP
jgi:60kDa lysophospholipase